MPNYVPTLLEPLLVTQEFWGISCVEVLRSLVMGLACLSLTWELPNERLIAICYTFPKGRNTSHWNVQQVAIGLPNASFLAACEHVGD